MKLTKKQRDIVREVADAHQQYLDVDAKRSSAGEAYINAFGPDTRHTFRLPSGRQIEVYVPVRFGTARLVAQAGQSAASAEDVGSNPPAGPPRGRERCR